MYMYKYILRCNTVQAVVVTRGGGNVFNLVWTAKVPLYMYMSYM